MKTRTLKILVIALFLLDTACSAGNSTRGETPSAARSTADAIADELGLPANPAVQRVAPVELPNYPVTIDVFRQSADRPILGRFRPEYVAAIVPESELPESERARIAERRFAELSRYEFAVVSRNGRAERVMLTSIGTSAPNGDFRMDVVERTTRLEAEDGPSVPVRVAYPWLKTETLPEEPLTWGLWIGGGYFVSATPYYADLGLPAVNGGVKLAAPDAMALYAEAQETPTVMRIHAAGSDEAQTRLGQIATAEWLLPRIDASREQIAEVINLLGPEVRIAGHGWVDPLTGDFEAASWPKCGVFDCFKTWHVERPATPGFPGASTN